MSWNPTQGLLFGWTVADAKLGGSFGTVYKAIEKDTGDIVAIKHV